MPLVALIGNPNTGKTTLFNRLTGARARVGNYPGVTVERRVGKMRLAGGSHDGELAELLDLPGCYSLAARSPEEQIAIDAVLGLGEQPAPDLALVVVDAGQLTRNLYLVLQLIELDVPVVVALNMIDEVDASPDVEGLSDLFGCVFVPTGARSGEGMDALRRALGVALDEPPRGRVRVPYPETVLADASRVADALPERWRHHQDEGAGGRLGRARGLALWALASIEEGDELRHIPPSLRARVLEVQRSGDHDLDGEVIGARYAFLDEHLASLRNTPSEAADSPTRAQRLTARVDSILLHPILGFAVFVVIMLLLFQALFSWSDPAISLIESGFGWVGGQARALLPAGVLADLVSEGIIGGVGNVIVFLPQIVLLFLLIGLLEDSGYMARAAYLMDRVMKALGLHGRAFVPMLSGCACAIPAIMATRTMERERDRLLTMMVIPLMTCSARLPVYTLVIAALFPPWELWGWVPIQSLLMVFMYFFSTVVALTAAGVLGRTVLRGRRMPLLLELPPYRMPTWRSVGRQTFERAGIFLKEAGTVIAACTIVLWALLSYPAPEQPRPPSQRAIAAFSAVRSPPRTAAADGAEVAALADNSAALGKWQADKLRGSFGGQLGRALEPVIAPLGFDWKLGVGIVGAFAAREVFVSTLGLVYGIGSEADEESPSLREKMRADKGAAGRPAHTPLVGLSLMVFFALACQCMSTLAIVKRETNGWKWPLFLFAYMSVLAWVASFLVYQGGKLLGFDG